MSEDPSRRAFLQGLLATVGSAVLVKTVKPAEVRALVGLPAEEALEYEPEPAVHGMGSSAQAQVIFASVRQGPLRLTHNFGFRYLARGRVPGSIRLYYHSGPFDMAFMMAPSLGEEPPPVFAVTEMGIGYVEVCGFDTRNAHVVEADFDIMVMRLAVAKN